MTEIIKNPNRPIDDETLRIAKETLEKKNNIKVLSIYEKNNNICGIYIHSLHNYLTFLTVPESDISTNIDGHEFMFIELKMLLGYAYHFGSPSYYKFLTDAVIMDEDFNDILFFAKEHVPYVSFVSMIKRKISQVKNDDIDIVNIKSLLQEIEVFDTMCEIIDEPFHLDEDDKNYMIRLKVYLDNIESKLSTLRFSKISEKDMNELDKMFTKLCVKNDV
jgi:hypothetical protein